MHNIRKITSISYYKLMMALAMVVGLSLANVSEAQPVNSVREWHRCNVLWGSPLCISVRGSLNQRANIKVWYSKNSGPKRSARLYLLAFGKRCKGRVRQVLVAQGTVKPHETLSGGKVRHIYLYSCWVGRMRIGNRQFTTGELITR